MQRKNCAKVSFAARLNRKVKTRARMGNSDRDRSEIGRARAGIEELACFREVGERARSKTLTSKAALKGVFKAVRPRVAVQAVRLAAVPRVAEALRVLVADVGNQARGPNGKIQKLCRYCEG
jgi:hypothetical protein